MKNKTQRKKKKYLESSILVHNKWREKKENKKIENLSILD